jgi:hypothetical protein
MMAQETGCTTGDCENGKGRFLFQNADKYIGQFKNGKPDGSGVYYFKNGDIYKGQFKNGKRNGYGNFKWNSGESYIGEYLDDERHGEGTYYNVDGTIQEGTWEMGQFVKPKSEPVDTIAIVIRSADTTRLHSNLSADSTQKNTALSNGNFLNSTQKIGNQKRNALVIGNSNYLKNPLKNPKNDAISLASELQLSGFNVYLHTDISQKEMKIAIRDFGQILKNEGGVGLFYFAGHGLQSDGRNYLLPIDADIRKAQDIDIESIDLSRVLVEMDYAENELNLVILDACRDNPYKNEFKDSKNTHNGLASIQTAPYNSFIAFSTAPGAYAMDNKDSENGLYTKELLSALKKPAQKLEDIFKTVRANVRKISGGQQIPWEVSSIETDFYFKP